MSDGEIIKGFDLGILKRLFSYLKPYRRALGLSLASLAVGTVCELGVPVLLQNGIDQGIMKHDMAHLTLVAGLILGLLGLGMLAAFYQIFTMARISQNVMIDLRTGVFAHFQRQSSRALSAQPVGRLVSAVTSDVATLSDFFNTLFTSMLHDAVIMVGVVVTLFMLNPTLALFTVASLPPVLILIILFRTWSRSAYRRVRSQVSRVNAFLSEHLQGISIVQLFTAQDRSRKTFQGENQSLLNANLTELMVNAVFRPLIDVFWAATLGFLIWFGTGLSLQNSLSVGVLIAFINLVGRFYQPVGGIAENFTLLQSAMAGGERVFGFLGNDQSIADRGTEDFGASGPPSIRFDEVHFAYIPGEPVLQGLDFEVKAGHTVAVVGYTGAGKTTITSLLTRMWDIDSGRIVCGGRDIRDYTLDSLRGGIQSVLQDVFLFSATVAENIDLGRGLPREKIEEVCRLVQAHDFITALPQGYETPLTEGGSNLSAGQRQLLSFARVLAQNPRVLILDEATAQIDTGTEHLIQLALARLLQGRTSLVIAHRLSTIRNADRILVLDQGRIAEEGTHDELLTKKGFYWDLYKLQFEKNL